MYPFAQPELEPVKAESIATPEHDFRFFQYSKLALPLLLFILGIFTVLILLTMWQSKSDIRSLKAGVPRSLTRTFPAPREPGTESGVNVHKRDVRIAVFVMGIILTVATLGVFFVDMSPVMRARMNYPIGLMMLLVGFLSWIAFALDVNSERHARQCWEVPNQSWMCNHREDLATGCTVFDAFSALFLNLAGALVIAYTYSGDFCREKMQAQEFEVYGIHRAHQPGLLRNGVSTVRKKITLLSVLFALVFCIILMIFTIMLSEARDIYEFKDSNNRQLSGNSNTIQGWPLKNSKLRYAVCAFTIITILFNLIPLTSRIIAYVLGFLYLLFSVMSFSSFGIDIDAVDQAQKLQCPTNYKCNYDAYNTVCALDFAGAIMLIAYVIWEYFISKRSKPVDMSNAPPVVVA